MIARLRSIRADERGASVIELALAAPFLATIVIGMTDVSRAYSMKLQLEQAAQRSIEKVQQQASGSNDYSTLSSEANTAATAAGYSNSTVAVKYWLECNGTVTEQSTGAALSSSCSNGQTYARYVTVTITNYYTPMFAQTFFASRNADGTVTVSGYSGIRVQ